MVTRVPSNSDPRWEKIVRGELRLEPRFLGLKLLMLRIRMVRSRDASDSTARALAAELHDFFVQNARFLSEEIRQF